MVPGSHVLRGLLALAPVSVFLLVLVGLDTWRLVRPRKIFGVILAGFAAGAVSYVVNSSLIKLTGLPIMDFAFSIAPVVEECFKAAFVAWLLVSGRAGFLVDAAILGFGAGAGFAIVENLYYLNQIPDAPLVVWGIRGFGTAWMHGGVTAVFAVISRMMLRPGGPPAWRAMLPGLLVAAILHALFNRALHQPFMATGALAVGLPLLFVWIYRIGERRLRDWLGRGFDRDVEMLSLIREGQVRETPLGRYLVSLRDAFRPDIVADMLCLLRLQAELSIRAKGVLVLREQGLKPHPDQALAEKLAEMSWLERSVGRAGLLALRPVTRWRGAERWQRHLLEEETS